jgi:hypothetical protein
MGNSRQVVALRVASAWRRGRSVVDVISIKTRCEILYGYKLIIKLFDYIYIQYKINAFNVPPKIISFSAIPVGASLLAKNDDA